jgi:hypothetical protein
MHEIRNPLHSRIHQAITTGGCPVRAGDRLWFGRTGGEPASGRIVSRRDRQRPIVEDFAYEVADEKTLRWFANAIGQLDAADLLMKDDDFLNAVRSKIETLEAWRENHKSDLHTAADIFAEIKRTFGAVKREDVPYYFRYLARAIVPTADRDKILHDFAVEETALIANGTILPLGRRFVAERSK